MTALITPAYKQEQEILHSRGDYGTASIAFAPVVTQIINAHGITHLLDYGCSRLLNLYKHIKPDHKITYQAYDPAVAEYSEPPVPAQMVACIDVLEHIEPELLDSVLDDLRRVTEVILFCTVHTGPAVKTLSDGRNAHLIQQPASWWLPKLCERFEPQAFKLNDSGFELLATAKLRLESANGDQL